jgi:hypothetical protein
LIERIVDGAAQTFQELESRDSNLRLEGVHVARDEEAYVIHHARSVEAKVSVQLVLPVPLVARWLEDAKGRRRR